MTSRQLQPDTQAILLLCGGLGASRTSDSPLSASEYHRLAQWLHTNGLRPAFLLEPHAVQRLTEAWDAPVNPERVARLIERGAALALAVESWSNKGLWVISRSDSEYPQRIKARLGRSAPPILYGVGNATLLVRGGLAIVGSRDVDDEALGFTRQIAATCGRQGVQVISGAARGVDSEAMQAALSADGTVVGVLAESLMKAAVAGKYRASLRAGALALVTAYEPEVGFTVGNAMGRNRYIYALSDAALVVSASLGEGGTWSGATENLAEQWVPLFVRSGEVIPPGNRRLLEMGGLPLAQTMVDEQDSLTELLAHHVPQRSTPELPTQSQPVSDQTTTTDELRAHGEDTPTSSFPAPTTRLHDAVPTRETPRVQMSADLRADGADLFEIVWPHLERVLQTARTQQELAVLLHIEPTQARMWLERAVQDGRVTRLVRPTRYVATHIEPEIVNMPLF